MNKESSLTWGSQQAFAARAMMVVLLGSGIVGADEQQHAKEITPAKVEVRALEIRPSHDCEGYEGRFLFIHHGKKPLKIDCSERPMDHRYLPNNIQFQILKNGEWTQVKTWENGWCSPFDVPSGIPCELDVDLSPFKEEDSPLTCRVVFNWDKYPSEPFVLDWKSDREKGRFLAAKKAHVEELRAAFLKSGFRPELLQGDDFDLRLIKMLVGEFKKSGKVGGWYNLPEDDVEIESGLFWKGNVFIRIDGRTRGTGGSSDERFWGFIEWNPQKLDRALVHKLRKTDTEGGVTIDEKSARPDGFTVRIEPDDPVDDITLEYIARPFNMFLHFSLPENSNFPVPEREEEKKALNGIMDFLESSLKMNPDQPDNNGTKP